MNTINRPHKWLSLGLILTATFMWISSSSAATPDLKLPELLDASKMTSPTIENLGQREEGFGLPTGSQMPPFALKSHLGESFSDKTLLAQNKRLLVIFYRGGWCPYCNLQIHQLTEAFSEFDQRNVLPVLISVDQVDAAALAQRRYEIPFPVLSDPDVIAHTGFNVAMEMTPEMYEAYKGYGIDVEQWSGREHHKFAVASAFLVDKKGKILWSHASLNYKERPSVAQLLEVIDSIK